jgi:hypothetical protein
VSPARRGWIAVTEKESFVYSLLTGCHVVRHVEVGTVASVTRSGIVKRVADLCGGADRTPRDWDAVTILDTARLARPDAFLAECRDRQSTEFGRYRPFASLDDVRETARRYLTTEDPK